MHNYHDLTCIEILKNQVAAMGPKSKLLIAEMVIPHKVGIVEDLTPYWMDFGMINIGGRERSEKDFASILDAAGLKLIKIWGPLPGNQCVVEAVLKKET